MATAVVAEHVTKRYGDHPALDDVSLSVDTGAVFALVGPNGAGKTTLVRTLTGTTPFQSGTVTVLGSTPGRLDKDRIGLLPQAFTPPERLTPRELLEYYGGLYDAARDVDDVLADVGLETSADTWYERLSGGQQRRACVGLTLLNEPELLFLDEPTTGIDPVGRQDLWSLVASLAEGGTTVFLTTHDMDEAHTLADVVGLLDGGHLVETGTPDDLIEAYGGGSSLRVELDGAAAEELALDLDRPYERHGADLVFDGVAATAVGDVVRGLEAEGVAYESLTWSEPSLEDAYLNLTRNGPAPRGAVDGDGLDANAVPTAGRSS